MSSPWVAGRLEVRDVSGPGSGGPSVDITNFVMCVVSSPACFPLTIKVSHLDYGEEDALVALYTNITY